MVPFKFAAQAAAGCLLAAFVLISCAGEPSGYELALMQHRFDKNMALSQPDAGVLREQDRASFPGLRYFPPDTSFRFVVPLDRDEDPDYVLVEQRLSAPESHLKLGYVDIPFATGTERLTVFEYHPTRPDLVWIPFTDATSGSETYGGGRYLESPIENGSVTVDFNYAYNPYCDYNPDYNCAIPPPENRLQAAIRAGEMKSLLLGDH